ncbi:MAG: hypothetical protein IM600_17620 [Bacteroidetes bacterium]|nr:hypothetical protein [Bacteroidota bacterium]MCA6445252.1 hypothetical protein [Bacteroidota bacterium]
MNSNQHNQPNHFNLPKGYFENSMAAIKNKIECTEELKDYPQLLIKRPSGFETPDHYFQQVEARLENIPYSSLYFINKAEAGFITPSSYEAQVNERLNNLIHGPLSLLNTQPALKELPFNVPDNYFENKTLQLTQTLAPAETKVIPFNFMKAVYAIAAVLVLVVSVVWFKNYYKVQDNDCGNLACMDVNEIKQSKVLEGIETEDLYEAVDVNKLKNALTKKSVEPAEALPDSLMDELID